MRAIGIVGIVLVVIGVVALAVFLLADVIGLGSLVGLGSPGFGFLQITGTIAGGVALIVGLVLLFMKKKSSK